jgi:hypothetical protein
MTGLALALLLGADPSPGVVQEKRFGPGAVCRLELDARETRLSGRLRLTLTVEGPAPLVVTPHDPLLAESRPPLWKVRPQTDASDGADGRWRRSYRLDPQAVGDSVPVAVGPLKVRAGADPQEFTVAFDPIAVRVTTVVGKADLSELRPVTGVEEPPGPPPSDGFPWRPVGYTIAVVAVTAALVRWVRRGRRSAPLSAAAVAIRDIARLAVEPPDDFETRLVRVVRRYCEARFGLPATRQTSAEFLAAVAPAAPDPKPLETLRDLLERCDQARFAGELPAPAERERFAELALRFVTDTSPAPDPAG